MRTQSAVWLLLVVTLPLGGLLKSPRTEAVKVTVDTSEVPELAG